MTSPTTQPCPWRCCVGSEVSDKHRVLVSRGRISRNTNRSPWQIDTPILTGMNLVLAYTLFTYFISASDFGRGEPLEAWIFCHPGNLWWWSELSYITAERPSTWVIRFPSIRSITGTIWSKLIRKHTNEPKTPKVMFADFITKYFFIRPHLIDSAFPY